MNINDILYKELDSDKIKIVRWNKNKVPMTKFLSFLKVKTRRSENFLGKGMGWTQRENKEHKLIIAGGWYGKTEYLHMIEYGHRIDNPYNNFVNPLQMQEILTDEGKKFFLDYYREDIDKIINRMKEQNEGMKRSIEENQLKLNLINIEILNIVVAP